MKINSIINMKSKKSMALQQECQLEGKL